MTIHVRCGSLITGDANPARHNATIGIGDDGRIAFVCATACVALHRRACCALDAALGVAVYQFVSETDETPNRRNSGGSSSGRRHLLRKARAGMITG